MTRLEPQALVSHFLAHPPRSFSADQVQEGVPAFTARFDLLTTAEPAFVKKLSAWPLHRYWRPWLSLRTRFIGSTVTEYAWLPTNTAPEALARDLRERQGKLSKLLIVKDIPQDSPLLDPATNAWCASFADACETEGFMLLEGQALAWAPIDFDSTETYLARLSRSRRRNLRRKLRSRADLDVEVLATGKAFADDATVDAFHALYCNVYAQSELQFDFLERDFFAAVLRDEQCPGVVFVYRHQAQIIGWNLCFEHGDMLVDKYMGLRYPQARTHNLYTVSWFVNLQYALDHQLHGYVAGWSDPQAKAELGAQFTFTRHAVYLRSRVLRWLLGRATRFFENDRAWREERAADAAPDS